MQHASKLYPSKDVLGRKEKAHEKVKTHGPESMLEERV